MKRFYLLTLLFCFTLITYGQNKEVRNVKDFTSLSIGVPADVVINKGSDYKVVIEGDEDDLKEIETEVEGKRLKIKHENSISFWNDVFDEKVRIYITMPSLSGVILAGSGTVESQDLFVTNDFEVEIAGSGKAYLNIDSNETDIDISGSGKVFLKGKTNEAEINISGSGDVEAEDFEIAKCDIKIMGSGDCQVNVIDRLESTIMGSGDIYYSGNPKHVNNNTMGSGRVKKI